jgi:carboxypeptidase C (cathepsin A)
LIPLAAFAQETAVTHHSIGAGASAVAYTAEVGRIPIRDVETGEIHGQMGYTAYRLDDPGQSRRPLTFIWNGGPGANSALLHFKVSGPKRYQDGALIDNPNTWLADTDLVMVDPIGTGFSRPAKREYAGEFYGTRGDVASVTEFIRAYRILKRAEGAPLFLVGESWGAGRAASVGYALESRGIRVDGLVLISGGWAINGSYGSASLREALKVVDMAGAAFFYHKTSRSLGSNVAQVRAATERWVRQNYAPALARVDRLPAAERDSIRRALSEHTGIALDAIDPRTLTLSPRQFRENILKREGQTPSPFDLRERRGEQPEFSPPVIVGYFRDDLGYRTELPYIDLEPATQGFAPSGKLDPDVGERWDYATADLSEAEIKTAIDEATVKGNGPPRLGPPLPATEEAVGLNPDLKILVASGMYDGFLPCAAGAEAYATLPEKLKRAMQFKCYAGGHAMYLDEPARLELSRDVGQLIRTAVHR